MYGCEKMTDINKELDAFLAEEQTTTQQPVEPISKSEVAPAAAPVEDDSDDNPDIIEMDDDFAPTLNDKTPAEIAEEHGVREKMDGKILTVKSWEFTKPKTFNIVGGVKVPVPPLPKKQAEWSDEEYAKKAKFYQIKVKVKFEENNLVEYYPSLNVFLNEGKMDSRFCSKASLDCWISFMVARVVANGFVRDARSKTVSWVILRPENRFAKP